MSKKAVAPKKNAYLPLPDDCLVAICSLLTVGQVGCLGLATKALAAFSLSDAIWVPRIQQVLGKDWASELEKISKEHPELFPKSVPAGHSRDKFRRLSYFAGQFERLHTELASRDIKHTSIYKILLAGPSGAGKSSLLMRYAENFWSDQAIPTIGVDFKICPITSKHNPDFIIKLQIWDTYSRERFARITASYYRGSDGIFVCADLTDKTSLYNAETYKGDIERYANPGIPVILVGTKCDAEGERKVTREEIEETAKKWGWQYIETSSKESLNIEELFMTMAEKIHQNRVQVKKPDYVDALVNGPPPPKTAQPQQQKKGGFGGWLKSKLGW